jgi:hypothetical protein
MQWLTPSVSAHMQETDFCVKITFFWDVTLVKPAASIFRIEVSSVTDSGSCSSYLAHNVALLIN